MQLDKIIEQLKNDIADVRKSAEKKHKEIIRLSALVTAQNAQLQMNSEIILAAKKRMIKITQVAIDLYRILEKIEKAKAMPNMRSEILESLKKTKKAVGVVIH